jgi:hypothetical protein
MCRHPGLKAPRRRERTLTVSDDQMARMGLETVRTNGSDPTQDRYVVTTQDARERLNRSPLLRRRMLLSRGERSDLRRGVSGSRRAGAWVRVVNRSDMRADEPDDPDEAVSSASERLALVDTLMLIAVRNGASDGTEPRLQRSVSRVLKRPR